MPSSPLLCLCDICVGQEDFVSQCTSCPACRYCLSACQSQLLDVDLRSRNKSNLSSRQCNCIKHFFFFLCCSLSVWDESAHARNLQRKGGHVQTASATWSRCQLQPARTRIHSADVCWPLWYRNNTLISRAYHSVGDILRWSNLRPDSVFLQVKLTSRG